MVLCSEEASLSASESINESMHWGRKERKKGFRLITNLSNEKDKGEEMTPQKLFLGRGKWMKSESGCNERSFPPFKSFFLSLSSE